MASLAPDQPKHIGRPKGDGFPPDKAQRICEAIESGLTIRKAAEQENISPALIFKYAAQNKAFGDQYARSLMIRTENDFESLEDLCNETPRETNFGTVDTGWVNYKKLQVDTRKWALSKRNPKKYGERLALDGEVTFSLADSIREARQRALAEDETLQLGPGDTDPQSSQ